MKIQFLSLLMLLLVLPSGCSTYRGLNDYQSSAALAEPDEEGLSLGPTLSLRGERKLIRPTDPIEFDWPVDEARMTRGFLTAKRRSHWGIDLANIKGTPILASERGIVIYTGRGFRGYGNLIVIEHNEQWATLYSHLDRISVNEGDVVERGQVIGKMGRTGRASGVHLHFEIRHNRQPVNPLAYLPGGTGSLATNDR